MWTVNYLTTLFLGKPLPETFYQYLVSILSPVTDSLLFLNQQKMDIFSTKEYVGCARISLGTAASEADTLPTELLRPVNSIINVSFVMIFRIMWNNMKTVIQKKCLLLSYIMHIVFVAWLEKNVSSRISSKPTYSVIEAS